jgi:glycosyltransferase involved in cell wall biosynthesis
MPEVAIVSYRLGGTDGVSIEAAKWAWAFNDLGWTVRTVAGGGGADHLLPGLAIDSPAPPAPAELLAALGDADLVVAENICSLPMNPPVTAAVAAALARRPAVIRHHDLPWEREAHREAVVPDDPAWRHVCITRHAARSLDERGVEAEVIHNRFDPDPPAGDRAATRRALGVGAGELLVLQPTRAIRRKNVPGGLALAEALGATYWLLGGAEDGYDGELEGVLAGARTRVVRGGGVALADAYAACDLVALPSNWEGFGNPAIESATHRRLLAIGSYPAQRELASYGFAWFDAGDPATLAGQLANPDRKLLEHNLALARRHFSLVTLPRRLSVLVSSLGGPGQHRAH